MISPSVLALAIALPLVPFGTVNETPVSDADERVAVRIEISADADAEAAADTLASMGATPHTKETVDADATPKAPSRARTYRDPRDGRLDIVVDWTSEDGDAEQAFRPPIAPDRMIVSDNPRWRLLEDEEQGPGFVLHRSVPRERKPWLNGAFEDDSSEELSFGSDRTIDVWVSPDDLDEIQKLPRWVVTKLLQKHQTPAPVNPEKSEPEE